MANAKFSKIIGDNNGIRRVDYETKKACWTLFFDAKNNEIAGMYVGANDMGYCKFETTPARAVELVELSLSGGFWDAETDAPDRENAMVSVNGPAYLLYQKLNERFGTSGLAGYVQAGNESGQDFSSKGE